MPTSPSLSPELVVKVKSRVRRWRAEAHKRRTFITRSATFCRLVEKAFKATDADKSGAIDSKEVYCAVLLVYVEIVRYVPYATPPSREYVDGVIELVDSCGDGDGTLSLDEFKSLCMILGQELGTRVAVEAAILFFLGPVLAKFMLDVAGHTLPTCDSVPSWLSAYYSSILVSLTFTIAAPLVIGRLDHWMRTHRVLPVRRRGDEYSTPRAEMLLPVDRRGEEKKAGKPGAAAAAPAVRAAAARPAPRPRPSGRATPTTTTTPPAPASGGRAPRSGAVGRSC